MGTLGLERWWGAVLLVGTAACVPMGPPPAGRQIVAGRGATLAAIIPPSSDDLLRVVLLRPGSTSDTVDMSVVSVDAANQASPEVPLISGISPFYSVDCLVTGPLNCGVVPDGIFHVQSTDGSEPSVNAVTGEVVDHVRGSFGSSDFLGPRSDSGARMFHVDSPNSGTLYEADGHATPVQLGASGPVHASFGFVGEDFYYLDPQQNLIEIPPSDTPQQLATGITQFTAWHTPDGPLLVVDQTTAPATMQTLVLEPASMRQTALPFGTSHAEIAPSGGWALDDEDERNGKFTFFDYRSGTLQTVQVDGTSSGHVWRPGTSEAWVTVADSSGELAVWVLRPDAPPVVVPGAYMESLDMSSGVQPFTDDGAYWFFTTTPLDGGVVIRIGRADDPTGPSFPLNPPSTYITYGVPLPDGRFVSAAYPKDQDRSDVTVLDPRTGQTAVLGTRGLLVAAGQTRLMGIFRINQHRGDLTTVAFDTGRATVLAPEFALKALAEPQGSDALPAGARIVYQFEARAASPYDGIWVTTCP